MRLGRIGRNETAEIASCTAGRIAARQKQQAHHQGLHAQTLTCHPTALSPHTPPPRATLAIAVRLQAHERQASTPQAKVRLSVSEVFPQCCAAATLWPWKLRLSQKGHGFFHCICKNYT